MEIVIPHVFTTVSREKIEDELRQIGTPSEIEIVQHPDKNYNTVYATIDGLDPQVYTLLSNGQEYRMYLSVETHRFWKIYASKRHQRKQRLNVSPFTAPRLLDDEVVERCDSADEMNIWIENELTLANPDEFLVSIDYRYVQILEQENKRLREKLRLAYEN